MSSLSHPGQIVIVVTALASCLALQLIVLKKIFDSRALTLRIVQNDQIAVMKKQVRSSYLAPLVLLSLAFVLSAARPTDSAPDTEFVSVSNFKFTPAQATINVGDTVSWANDGGFHNVVADDGRFRNGDPATSAWTYDLTFDTPGAYHYYCEIHGAPGGVGMSGTIIVQGAPPVLDQFVYLPLVLK